VYAQMSNFKMQKHVIATYRVTSAEIERIQSN